MLLPCVNFICCVYILIVDLLLNIAEPGVESYEYCVYI